jgi:argininosuccinate lyase
MTRLWDKGAPLDERVLEYTAGEDYALDERLVPYDVRASIAHAEMLAAQQLLSDCGPAGDRAGLEAHRRRAREGLWRIELSDEDGQTALEKRLTAADRRGRRTRASRSLAETTRCSPRSALLRDAVGRARFRRASRGRALDRLAARDRNGTLPGYTHMQQAMPSSVALWAGGFAAELRDDAKVVLAVAAPREQEPARFGRGYGTPGCRSIVRRRATATSSPSRMNR